MSAKAVHHGILYHMLFNKKHKKVIGAVWAVVCFLIIVSMVLLYTPIFR